MKRQVALITGAGRGLGQAWASALGAQGFAVAVTARSDAEIQAVAQAIIDQGGAALAVAGDVTDGQAVARTVALVEAQLGPIDLLINNAGSFHAFGLIAEVDPDEWWREVEVNLRGPLRYTRAVLPSMIARQRGRIINVASGAGLGASPAMSAYNMSKAALIRFSESIDLETRALGIATFAIHPGTVRTPMNAYVHESDEVGRRAPQLQQWFRTLYAENRDTPIERSVELVLALAAGRADLLSGCYIAVDDDLDALVARASEIQQDSKQKLRLRV